MASVRRGQSREWLQEPIENFVLELSEGRVIDAVAWPPGNRRTDVDSTAGPAESWAGPGPKGSWRLGKEPEGRVRVRIEAPLDAGVVVRGGESRVTLPLLAILERPQHTPQQSPLMVSVERLAWDSLAVDLGEPAHDGIVAPGTEVPVSIAFNILVARVGRGRRSDDGRSPLDSRGRRPGALRASGPRGRGDQPA